MASDKPQEALKIRKNPHSEDVDNEELSRFIAEALKKQITKKPLDICTPVVTCVVTWGLCPICKGELNKLGNQPHRIFKDTKYCSDCGQALDWSDDK